MDIVANSTEPTQAAYSLETIKHLPGWTMKNTDLLRALRCVSGVVEHSISMKILSYIKISIKDGVATLSATDTEMEVQCLVNSIECQHSSIEITVSLRRISEVAKTFSQDTDLQFYHGDHWLYIVAGEAVFRLTSLSVEEFPHICFSSPICELALEKDVLLELLKNTSFSMGNQDVRFYLNGVLLQIKGKQLSFYGSDAHRLSVSTAVVPGQEVDAQSLVSRKAVLELAKVLKATADCPVSLFINENYLNVIGVDFNFKCTLVDVPQLNYESLLPTVFKSNIRISKEVFVNVLMRSMVLSNDRFSDAILEISAKSMRILSINLDQERIEEKVAIESSSEPFKISVNVGYLLDVLKVIDSEQVLIHFYGENRALFIEDQSEGIHSRFIIMPLSSA